MLHRILAAKQDNGWRAKSNAHIPVVMVLFLAGLLKIFQLASTPDDVNFVFGSKSFTILLIEYELVLAGWLFCGAYGHQARFVGLTTFVGFATASAIKFIAGEEHCDCFGTIRVRPSISFAVNLTAIVLLTLWEVPYTTIRRSSKWHHGALLVLILLALLPLFMFQVSSFDGQGNIIGNSRLVVLEPDAWVGNALPIRNYVEHSSQLMQGKWQLVFYDEHCGKCQNLIHAARNSLPEIRAAFIEVPPYRAPVRQSNRHLVWLRLSDDRDWFIKTPSTLMLENGIVTSCVSRSRLSRSVPDF